MTKKTARILERRLKDYGVYDPYVCEDNGFVNIESYPLSASIMQVFRADEGPHASITIYDHSLARMGSNAKVDHEFTHFGQDVLQRAAELLRAWHPEAYARAKGQDALAGC